MFGQIASKSKKCKLIAATVRTSLIANNREHPAIRPAALSWTMSTSMGETRQLYSVGLASTLRD
jgi:hypothetical protein